jgi:hypothetical protein
VKGRILIVAALTLLLGGAAQAGAGTVYSNGPIDGQIGNIGINNAFEVSNSFQVTTATTITIATVGLWVDAGATPGSLDWSIGTTNFGSDNGSGSSGSLTNTFHNSASNQDGNFDVYSSSFSLSLTLAPGTYWLTLSKGAASDGGSIGWDANGGPSMAFLTTSGSMFPPQPVPSESFTLFNSAVPEPTSLGLLGVGSLGLLGYRWKKRKQAPV